jgi:hypothetical protein
MSFLAVPRSTSLRSQLTLLVAGSILPLAAVAAITTYILSKAYDDAAEARLLLLSRLALGNMEGRIEAIITAEEVLAVGNGVQSGNLDDFRNNAETYLKSFMPSANLVLSDLTGSQIVNTSATEPMSRRKITSAAVQESHRRIIASGNPELTQVFKGQVIGQYAVSVEVPVIRDGKVVYIIGMPVTAKLLSDMLADQQFDPHWTVAMWDRGGKVIARSPDWQPYVGRQAVPSIYPAVIDPQDRVITTTTFQGEEVLTAIAHAPQLGLSLAIGLPRELVVAPRRQALFFIIGFSALCLLISGFAATRLARSLLAASAPAIY